MAVAKDQFDISASGGAPQISEFDGGSQIVEFYRGRCILVTGASGFLGKCIIEKLLRTCTEIKRIFVLVRPRRNKSASERVQDLISSPLFDKLRSRSNHGQPFEQLIKKLTVLEGSLEQPNLGLDDERVQQVVEEVSVIIHSAAIVSFVGKLRDSSDTNLAGTRNVLQLATKLPKLCALVHVSTCYSNCTRKSIKEHLYPVPMEPLDLLKIVENLEDKSVEIVRNKLIGGHPNNYTLTKQLAEYLCGQYAVGPHHLPVLICRPSVIIATLNEPIKGFLDNHKAANGLFEGVSRGFYRFMEGSRNVRVDLVPADLVSNHVISLAWFANLYHRARLRAESLPVSPVHDEIQPNSKPQLECKMDEFYQERKKATLASTEKLSLDEKLAQVVVVNVSSGAENPIRMQKMYDFIAKYSAEYPHMELFRTPGCTLMKNRFLLCSLLRFIAHTVVGNLMDCFCRPPEPEVSSTSQGKRRVTWSMQFQRCDALAQVLTFFLTHSFKFESRNRRKLIDEFMNDEDRKQFECDFRRVNYESYARDMVWGIRRHLIGERDETLPEARQRFARIQWRAVLVKFASIVLASCFAYNLFL